MNYSLAILLVFLTTAYTPSIAEEPPTEPDVIFTIGMPDARCAEFALVREGYAAFPHKFPDGILYEVGKNMPENDWPFVHPSIQDRHWAGGNESHPFTIRFSLDEGIEHPTTFIIGYMGSHPSRSTVHVAVNGTELPTQVPPHIGYDQVVYHPRQPGQPASMLFTVPGGTLEQGINDITIVLVGRSWILYDYIALRKEAQPLVHREPPPLNLLAQFQAGNDAPMADVKEILFAVRIDNHEHWYANFGYPIEDDTVHPYRDHDGSFHSGRPEPGPKGSGMLGILNLDTQEVRYILKDEDGGAIRDPIIHYDGEKVLFSYRPGGTRFYHLYEINTDGTGLRQLTDGDYDDIEPTYTPEGNIIFVSSRCKRWVQCWMTQVAILYSCDADGNNMQVLSGNVEHDNTPWMLPNGQVLYTRWEYVDRSQVDYHHLWTMNPDGTRQMVFYGNLHPGVVYIDAKPIPNSEKVVASFSWGHGRAEHAGSIGIIDPRKGPDDRNATQVITSDSTFRDPWAFSETAFLAARRAQMVLVDGNGQEQIIYELPDEWQQKSLWLHEPRPIIKREPERIISSMVDPAKTTGQLLVMDVTQGRNMDGVEQGEIKKLLILETLPKPVNFTGGMEPLTYGGSFTLERIVGTVPVEEDGSANFELPATRSFFFVALDENNRSVKRMQSFLTVMPGEVTACIGCHEERTETMPMNRVTTASRRPPSPITPIADFRGIDPLGNLLAMPTGMPDVIDFPRDIQPILDARCIQCHSPENREGGISLIGNRSPLFSLSYFAITANSLVADGRNLAKSNYPPRVLGTGSSRLLDYCEESHYGVQLSDRERALLHLWIDSGATYPGTYAALGSGMVGGYYRNTIDRRDLNWPEIQAMQQVLRENCISCHTEERNMQLPLSPSEEIGNPPWVPLSPNDVRRKFARHLLYDLTEPERSILLLGPLAKSAGGYEACGRAVLAGKDDPRYQAILSGIQRTKQHLDEVKRFDMPDFVPRTEYIREMKRYGILPTEHDPSAWVDYYDLEQRYWHSLW